MKDNSTGNIKVTYYSNCVGDGPLRQTNKCNGLRVGSQVKFTGKYISSLICARLITYFGNFVFGFFVTLVASCPSCLAKCKQRLRNIFITLSPKLTKNEKWNEKNISQSQWAEFPFCALHN